MSNMNYHVCCSICTGIGFQARRIEVICYECDGSGVESPDPTSHCEKCVRCQGRGIIMRTKDKTVCRTCHGTGKIEM